MENTLAQQSQSKQELNVTLLFGILAKIIGQREGVDIKVVSVTKVAKVQKSA